MALGPHMSAVAVRERATGKQNGSNAVAGFGRTNTNRGGDEDSGTIRKSRPAPQAPRASAAKGLTFADKVQRSKDAAAKAAASAKSLTKVDLGSKGVPKANKRTKDGGNRGGSVAGGGRGRRGGGGGNRGGSGGGAGGSAGGGDHSASGGGQHGGGI